MFWVTLFPRSKWGLISMKLNKQFFAASLLSAALVTNPASADLGDILIGGAIGAIVVDQVHKNNNKKKSSGSSSSGTTKYVQPSLNSQYSTQERIQIQQSLAAKGYNVGTIDGILGPQSRNAISLYQSSLGQPATGQLTGGQYASLTSVSTGQPVYSQNRTLRYDEIVMLQQGLQSLGYYNGEINGVAGPGTNGALHAYLVNQKVTPGTVNPVQALVMVTSSAGMVVPPYLMQEAGYGSGQPVQGSGTGTIAPQGS